MRSISEELSELKTSLWGYDKEAVQLLIRQILLENEEQLEKETSKLLKQNRSLELELNESRERLEMMTGQFEHLSEKLDKMTEAMGKGTEYSKERDQELREFHKKETEIETLYEKAQKEAQAERERLLADVEKEQAVLMEQAQAERDHLIEEGQARKQQLIQEGMEEKQHLEEEMEQLKAQCSERMNYMQEVVDSFKHQFFPVFTWADLHFPEGKKEEKEAGAEDVLELDEEAEDSVKWDEAEAEPAAEAPERRMVPEGQQIPADPGPQIHEEELIESVSTESVVP